LSRRVNQAGGTRSRDNHSVAIMPTPRRLIFSFTSSDPRSGRAATLNQTIHDNVDRIAPVAAAGLQSRRPRLPEERAKDKASPQLVCKQRFEQPEDLASLLIIMQKLGCKFF
jgi:hypothetical protein